MREHTQRTTQHSIGKTKGFWCRAQRFHISANSIVPHRVLSHRIHQYVDIQEYHAANLSLSSVHEIFQCAGIGQINTWLEPITAKYWQRLIYSGESSRVLQFVAQRIGQQFRKTATGFVCSTLSRLEQSVGKPNRSSRHMSEFIAFDINMSIENYAPTSSPK